MVDLGDHKVQRPSPALEVAAAEKVEWVLMQQLRVVVLVDLDII
jgi:hypothetical protein